ncbi:hypothetical protein ACHAXS_013667 [Conticribra weissflogii]
MPTKIPSQSPDDNRSSPGHASSHGGGSACGSMSSKKQSPNNDYISHDDGDNPRQHRQDCRKRSHRLNNHHQQHNHEHTNNIHRQKQWHERQQQQQRQQEQQASAKNPKPPPSATQVQLGLWDRILKHRTEQIHDLSPSYFLSYANDIILQLKNSQHGKKDYSAALNHSQLAGVYTSHLLTMHPPPPNLARISVVRHLQALFFRSIDDRLPIELRQHGLDGLTMALRSLDAWMAKFKNYCEAYRLEKEEDEKKKKLFESGSQTHQPQQQQDQEKEGVDSSSARNGDQRQAGKRKNMEGTCDSSSDKIRSKASDSSSNAILTQGTSKRSRGYDISNNDNRQAIRSSTNDASTTLETANTNTAECSAGAAISATASTNAPPCPADTVNEKSRVEVSESTTGETATESKTATNLVVRPVVPRTGKAFLPPQPLEPLVADDSDRSSLFSSDSSVQESKSKDDGIDREMDENTERPMAQAANNSISGENKQCSTMAKPPNTTVTGAFITTAASDHGDGKQLPTNPLISAAHDLLRGEDDINVETGGQKTQTTLRAEPKSYAVAGYATLGATTTVISTNTHTTASITDPSTSSNSSHNAPTKRKAPDDRIKQSINPPEKTTTISAQRFCSSGNKKAPQAFFQSSPSTTEPHKTSNTTEIISNNNSHVANATTNSSHLAENSPSASLTNFVLSKSVADSRGNTEQTDSVGKSPAIIEQSNRATHDENNQMSLRSSRQTPAPTPAVATVTTHPATGTAVPNVTTNSSKSLASVKQSSVVTSSESVNGENIRTLCNNEVHSLPKVNSQAAKTMTKSSVASSQSFIAPPIDNTPDLENSQQLTVAEKSNSIIDQPITFSLGIKETPKAPRQTLFSPIRMVVPLQSHTAKVGSKGNSIASTAKHTRDTESLSTVPKMHCTPKSTGNINNDTGHQKPNALPKLTVSNAESSSAPSGKSILSENQASVLTGATATARIDISSKLRMVDHHDVVGKPSYTTAPTSGQLNSLEEKESSSERKEGMHLEQTSNNKNTPSAFKSCVPTVNNSNRKNRNEDALKPTDKQSKQSKYRSGAKKGDCDSDVEILDLTDDYPLSEPPPNTREQQKDVCMKLDESANLTDIEEVTSNQSPSLANQGKLSFHNRPPSPPPSPPPKTRILRNLPPHRPRPSTFCSMRNLHFPADKRNTNSRLTSSSGLKERSYCLVNYDAGFHLDGSGSCMDDESRIDVRRRLETWDPYWEIIEELGTKQVRAEGPSNFDTTTVGTRTSSCRPVPIGPNPPSFHPSSCSFVSIDLPTVIAQSSIAKSHKTKPWGVQWGEFADPSSSRLLENYKTGDRRLIVRTLPLHRTNHDWKRADTHIWPKGSFITLVTGEAARTQGEIKSGSKESVMVVFQRKQQTHDHNMWKGNSYALDLTKFVSDPRKEPIGIKLGSIEIVENKQGVLIGTYAIHVAICEYVGADTLHDQLMRKIDGGNVLIPTLSLRSAKKLAIEYIANQTVSIDSDEVGSQRGPDITNSLTFSLLCPMSKQILETPVRGRHCRHMQCFDLRNFLRTNEIVSGGRWRCGVCEDFLSVRDLIHCGLFQEMLDEYRNLISGSRDKVSFRSDGTWMLKEENKLRYAKKRPNSIPSSDQTRSKSDHTVHDTRQKANCGAEPEVIELL